MELDLHLTRLTRAPVVRDGVRRSMIRLSEKSRSGVFVDKQGNKLADRKYLQNPVCATTSS